MSIRAAYVSAMCAVMCVALYIMHGVRNVLRRGAQRGAPRCVRGPVLVAMTLKNDLLNQMRYEWIYVGHSPQSRTAMTTLSKSHEGLALARARDPSHVVTL